MIGNVRIWSGQDVIDSGANLVVNSGRALLAELSADAGLGDVVAHIGFGLSDGEVSPDDIELLEPFVKAVDSFDFPEDGKVTFHWSLDYGEANGMSFKEIGLLSAEGVLIARRLPAPAIDKTEDVSLTGTWTLIF